MRTTHQYGGGHRNTLVGQPGSTEAVGTRTRAREANARVYIAYRHGCSIDLSRFVLRTRAGGWGGNQGDRFFMKRALDIALRYGVAALAVGVMLVVKVLLDPWIAAQPPFLLLAGALVVSAWFGGPGPGLLATALGALGADYLFLPPEGSFTGLAVAFWWLLLFTLQGLLISSLVEALRAALARGRCMEEVSGSARTALGSGRAPLSSRSRTGKAISRASRWWCTT